MAGLSSHKYKQYERTQRKVVTESAFTGGMNYSDNPLDVGVSKLIVNMIQKDFGKRVRPRGGWRVLRPPLKLGEDLGELYIHHTGTTFVTNTDTEEVYLRRYALLLSQSESGDYGSLTNSKVLVEEPLDVTDPEFKTAPGTLVVSNLKADATIYDIKHDSHKAMQKLHNMLVESPSPTGMYASIEGNTYLLTPEGLGRLHVYYDGTNYTHEVKLVTPLEVTPMQAVNYGYNMLLPEPYEFENKVGPTFTPYGILPYDSSTGLIKMQAKVGEPVRFKLIYQYKQDEEYKVQWEVQDIYKRDGINIIQAKDKSPTYKNGEDIYLDYTSPLKQFSVVATIYPANDLENSLRTMVLASYHLADDLNSIRIEQKKYDLMSATGMSVWKNQVVLYGVTGAEMTVFLSDINDPTNMPFPNNAIIFNEKVVKAFPYMNSLIVVTEHTMFQVDFGPETGFVSKPVQTNMQLRDDDAMSMYGVRNMVCFKSRNYYYMVVPNIKNDRGELQVAPISNTITQLLDTFSASTRNILSEVYTLQHLFNAPNNVMQLSLYDYASYPDGNRLRHVYKLKLQVYEEIYYIDFHLVYDTIYRTWMLEVMQSTRRPLHVFQTMATDYAHFLSVYDVGNETYVQWLTVDENNPEDEFHLDENAPRMITNFQMLDTGKRNLDGTLKKRLRQLILEFNNLSKEDLEFNHITYIDDEPRSDLFAYSVTHDTDPESPTYGQIYVEREYVDPTTVYGTTKLGIWSLGNSQFPEQTVLKVHLDITGKGYYPRVRLITRTSKLYELNQISWVYRDMNSR